MKGFIHYILLLALSLSVIAATAQIKVTEEKDIQSRKSQPIAAADAPSGVVMHADPRIAVLLKKYRNVQLGVIRSGHGYRVQIYNGNDRVKANSTRMDFMRRYPTVHAYLTYTQPQFRVKVGDFGSRGEAYKFYAEVSNVYDPCMIVPDIVVINTLRDD